MEELTGNNSGQSLIEVLIALVIFTLIISAVAFIFFGGQNYGVDAASSQEALFIARDGLEASRAVRDKDWSLLTEGFHGVVFGSGSQEWGFYSTSDSYDIFKRVISISDRGDGSKLVISSVSWQLGDNRSQEVALTEVLGPLNQAIHGDWTMPCILGSVDAGSGAKGSDVYYYRDKAFVTSNAQSSGKEDLFIFDVLDPKNPFLLSEMKLEQGLKAVTVREDYAYAIEADSPDFFVIDARDPENPTQVAKLTLNGGAGKYVMVQFDYVYATTASNSGDEFFVIDVSTPSTPQIVASLDFQGDMNEVSVLRDIAYVATSNDDEEVVLIDITDPLNPSFLSSFDLSGDIDGRSIHAKNITRIYVGRLESSGQDELYILDATDPLNIVLRGSEDVSDDVLSIITASTLSFLGTRDTNDEFQAYFIRFPDNIQLFGTLNFSNIATGADYYNNIVYMSVQNADILQLVTSTGNTGGCGE